MTLDDETFLTPKEAARYLRRPEGTLASWRSLYRTTGKRLGPKYVKQGGSVLYRMSDLDAYKTETLRSRY